jgi:hypothetical protein
VVDTIGENDKTQMDRFGTPHSEALHVIERYRPSPDGKSIGVDIRVEDPVAFTTAWSARAHYARDKEPFLEIVCAESERPVWPGRDIPFPKDDTPDF